MIENHRSGLLHDLLMNAPEVQAGMKGLDLQVLIFNPDSAIDK
jgi:hypothetical protein